MPSRVTPSWSSTRHAETIPNAGAQRCSTHRLPAAASRGSPRRGCTAQLARAAVLLWKGRTQTKTLIIILFFISLCLRACISVRKLPKLVQKLGPSGNAYVLYCVHLIQGGWLGKDSAPRLAIVEYLWVQRDSGKDGGHHGRDGAAGSQRRWGANVALRSGLL